MCTPIHLEVRQIWPLQWHFGSRLSKFMGRWHGLSVQHSVLRLKLSSSLAYSTDRATTEYLWFRLHCLIYSLSSIIYRALIVSSVFLMCLASHRSAVAPSFSLTSMPTHPLLFPHGSICCCPPVLSLLLGMSRISIMWWLLTWLGVLSANAQEL